MIGILLIVEVFFPVTIESILFVIVAVVLPPELTVGLALFVAGIVFVARAIVVIVACFLAVFFGRSFIVTRIVVFVLLSSCTLFTVVVAAGISVIFIIPATAEVAVLSGVLLVGACAEGVSLGQGSREKQSDAAEGKQLHNDVYEQGSSTFTFWNEELRKL